MDFGGIILALESGQIDGAIAGANITEARKKADAAFEDLPVISYTLNQDPDTQLKVGTEKLTNVDNGFMVKKGSHQE